MRHSPAPSAGGTISALNLLRTLAIAGVVTIHTSAAWLGDSALPAPNLYSHINRSVSFSVPTFLFLAGFLLFHRQDRAGYRHSAFLAGRLRTVLVPYLLWSLVYHFGFPHLGARAAGPGLEGLARNLLLGQSAYHLYFVVLIFQFYLLFPLFRSWLTRVRRPWLVLMAVLAFNLAEVWFYFGDWAVSGGMMPALRGALAPFRGRLFLTWIFYFILGALGGRYAGRLAGLGRSAPVARLLVLLGLLATWWATLAVHQYQMGAGLPLGVSLSYIQPSTMLLTAALAGTVFAYPLPALGRVWSLVSRHSYQVYLIHPILLDLALRRFPDRSPDALVFATAGVFVASLTSAALLSRLAAIIRGTPPEGATR